MPHYFLQFLKNNQSTSICEISVYITNIYITSNEHYFTTCKVFSFFQFFMMSEGNYLSWAFCTPCGIFEQTVRET